MMIDYYSLGSSALALVLAGGCLTAHRRFGQRSARENEALKEALDSLAAECHRRFTECEAASAATETSLASTRSVLADGRFHTSRRAEALRLLRSGVSPEAAAKTLGIAKVEMRLLASVYAVLTSK